MEWLSGLFGLVFGNNPIKTALDALNKAYETKVNAVTESEKIAADEHIQTLKATLADLAAARESAKTMPWWLAIPMGFIAFTGSVHVSAIFLASLFAPLLSRSDGIGYWLLNIPSPPGDYAKYEAEIVVFFFGGAVILAGVKSIVGAIGRR